VLFDDRIDTHLMEEAANAYPDYTFEDPGGSKNCFGNLPSKCQIFWELDLRTIESDHRKNGTWG